MNQSRDDNIQQAMEQEAQQWEEMTKEIERYIPFKEDFMKFVSSHERNANVQQQKD